MITKIMKRKNLSNKTKRVRTPQKVSNSKYKIILITFGKNLILSILNVSHLQR
jgi:hypothetical protein